MLLALALPSKAAGSPIGLLAQAVPVAKTYVLGEGLDFVPFVLSGLGQVFTPVTPIGVVIPVPAPNASSSGCDPAEFLGFPTNTIALLQRGTCSFNTKVLNAAAAGAAAVLIFNDGANAARMAPFEVALNALAPIPAIFTSFAVGKELFDASLSQTVLVALNVTDNTPTPPVPEPATLTLLGLGLGVAVRRRQ